MEGEAILTGTMEEAGAAVISKMDAAGKEHITVTIAIIRMAINNARGGITKETVVTILVTNGAVEDQEVVHEVSVAWTGVVRGDNFADKGEEIVAVIRPVVNPIRNSNKNAIEQCTVKRYNNAVRS